MKRDIGTVRVNATRELSVDAIAGAFRALGFNVHQTDRMRGRVVAVAAAPTPLSMDEWDRASAVEAPRMRAIARETLPVTSLFMTLHDDEVQVHAAAAVESAGGGATVTIEYTIVDEKAQRYGIRGAEQAPPAMARIGYQKAWREFNNQLTVAQNK